MRTKMLLPVLFGVLAFAVRAAIADDLVVHFSDEVFEYDHAHPAAGLWVGNVVTEKGTNVVSIDIDWKDGAGYSAVFNALGLGALHTDADSIDVADRQVTAVLKAGMVEAHFKGEINADGQRYAGECTLPARGTQPERTAKFELGRTISPLSLPNMHAYTGSIKLPGGGGDLKQSVILARTQGGHWVGSVDVPAQMLLGLPLVNITDVDGLITAVMPIPAYPATIAARIDKDTHHLAGHFKQAHLDLELDLPADAGYVAPSLRRPQQPKPPYPYESREVKIPTKASFDIAGTLTLPKTEEPFVTAVLITGSGQEDRDETIFGHKPFLVLSDYLARHGFAVLRCDDRGVGGTGGADTVINATSKDFANDVSAMVDFVKAHPGVDPKRVGVIGHSEGGLIGPMVATMRDDIAFVVMLAGPGVNGAEILEVQGAKLMQAAGVSAADVERYSAHQHKVLEMVEQGASEEAIRAEIAAAIEASAKSPQSQSASATSPAASQPDLTEQIDAQYRAITSAWMKYFLTYDPRPTLAKVKCPVLALNGTLDLQVWNEQNLPEVEKAVRSAPGGGDITAKLYPGLNHLFQPAKTGGVSEYGSIEITMDEQVLSDIVDWLHAKTAGPAH